MYAVIRTGGKQYTVKPGDILQVELLDRDLGSEFDINDVLMVGGESTHFGQPHVKDAKVTVVVTKQAKTRKIIVFKKKRRHSYRKFKTHRQHFTELFVKSITSPDGQVAKTETDPKVVNVEKVRSDRILAKIETRKAAIEASVGEQRKPIEKKKKVPRKKKAVKKLAKKSPARKTKKKSGNKKSAKKTSKKA